MFTLIMVVSILIIIVIILTAALTTSKAYSYKHTIDSIENNPNIKASIDDDINTQERSDN
ncbi:YtzI protein [Heyndrickxia sp. NPDC080065]|uniref:YtzI protein n=1 Tax=Heyndrickxia sp. NPDC080065 TaxID=3390568 RepID=UPI003D0646E0